MPPQTRALLPCIAAGFVSTAVVCGLLWPLPAHLSTWHGLSAFGDSHVWVFDQTASRLWSHELADPTCEAGYPFARHMRTIAWGPGLLFMPLSLFMGPIAATQLLQLISLPLSGIVAGLLIRRWTHCSPWTAQAMGVVYALCPTHLSHLATGEISNTQAWILPAWLLAMGSRPGRRGPLVAGLVAMIGAFSSPYTALALPLIGGTWIIGRCARQPTATWWVRSRGLFLRTGATGLALLPAWLYYLHAGGGESIFQPARRSLIEGGALPHPAPIATLDSLLWSSGGTGGSPFEPVHSAYLGLVLVGLAAWACWRAPGPGLRAGSALLIGGAILALGPVLALGGQVPTAAGHGIPLPVAGLEALGYPTRLGGLYYRFAMISVLGACILGAMGLSQQRPRWAWVLLILILPDAIRGTPSAWPRPSEPIDAMEELRELAGSDGAVLELPLQGPTDAWFGQSALLRATLHQRPTTALPRGVWDPRGSVQGLWTQAISSGESARAQLSSAGFRLVILPEPLAIHLETTTLPRLKEVLGEPIEAGNLLIWDLGPSIQPPVCASGG